MVMSYPTTGTLAPTSVSGPPVQGQPIAPTAMASGAHSAAWDLGQVLKVMVERTGVFLTEQARNDALRAVDKFTGSLIPAGAVRALATGDERAAHEDVSQRQAPAGATSFVPAAQVAIDYDKLAAALVRAQQAERQQDTPQVQQQ